jgi:hypothetical protein
MSQRWQPANKTNLSYSIDSKQKLKKCKVPKEVQRTCVRAQARTHGTLTYEDITCARSPCGRIDVATRSVCRLRVYPLQCNAWKHRGFHSQLLLLITGCRSPICKCKYKATIVVSPKIASNLHAAYYISLQAKLAFIPSLISVSQLLSRREGVHKVLDSEQLSAKWGKEQMNK